MDSSLSFSQHVMNTCRSAFLELRRIGLIHKYLTVNATETIVCSLVLSRLDYSNSIQSWSSKCMDYTKDAKNWTYYASSENVTLATNTKLNCLQDWLCMPHCVDYCIFKISVRAVECVYSSQTTALIIGSNYPQHYRSKNKVIWRESVFLPGTHQLEQGPWQH